MSMLWIFMMKWHEMIHKMMWYVCNAWNAQCTWNAKCATCVICVRCMKWHEMQIIDFGYMQRDVILIFDRDHNLIILFLILLRIWASVLMWNWLNRMLKICVYTGKSRSSYKKRKEEKEKKIIKISWVNFFWKRKFTKRSFKSYFRQKDSWGKAWGKDK